MQKILKSNFEGKQSQNNKKRFGLNLKAKVRTNIIKKKHKLQSWILSKRFIEKLYKENGRKFKTKLNEFFIVKKFNLLQNTTESFNFCFNFKKLLLY